MLDNDQIIQLIRMKGPVIPKDLMKSLNADTVMIGATLSELARQKKVFITKTKIGGSPFYYLAEQKERIQDLHKHLNEKDRNTFDLLKQKKVVKDTEEEPLTRVSLRNIKDFAMPFEVSFDNKTELFWKWYLLDKEETEKILREKFFGKKVEEPIREVKIPEKIEKIIKEEKKEETKEKPNVEIKKEEIKPKVPQKIEEKATTPEKEAKFPEKTETAQKTLEEDVTVGIKDELLNKTKKYFNKNNITIKSVEILRKNREIDCVVSVPSPVGEIEYYCKLKNKKKCNDGDLAAAYVKAQGKRLPALFVTTGDITKKAMEMLKKDFQNMKIIQI